MRSSLPDIHSFVMHPDKEYILQCHYWDDMRKENG
jgi:hypothetical protein